VEPKDVRRQNIRAAARRRTPIYSPLKFSRHFTTAQHIVLGSSSILFCLRHLFGVLFHFHSLPDSQTTSYSRLTLSVLQSANRANTMRPSTVILSIAAVVLQCVPVTADDFTVLERGSDRSNAMWHSDNGIFAFNANPDCRDPPIPGVYEVCMDWVNRRAHFRATGQNKRCLSIFTSRGLGSCVGTTGVCSIYRFHEVACTW